MTEIIYIASSLYSITISAIKVRFKPLKILNSTKIMILPLK